MPKIYLNKILFQVIWVVLVLTHEYASCVWVHAGPTNGEGDGPRPRLPWGPRYFRKEIIYTLTRVLKQRVATI